MADNIVGMWNLMVEGVRDSFTGVFRVMHIDKGLQDEKKAEDDRPQPMTILAQRRAERMKTKDAAKKTSKSEKLLPRIGRICFWNGGIYLCSICFMQWLVIPGFSTVAGWVVDAEKYEHILYPIEVVVTWMFTTFWILPVFILSKAVNSLWFQELADMAYRKRRGRPQNMPSFSVMLADVAFSLILQFFFLLQSMLVGLIPIPVVGTIVSMVHMCLLYSLYVFEYKWYNMGWEVNRRIAHIETNWPYYVGFGLPLALLTGLAPGIAISGGIFSFLFPFFIISATEAPSIKGQYDYPLRLFSPVIAITNFLMSKGMNSPGAAQPSTSSSSSSTSSSSPKRVTLQDKKL